MDWQLQFEACGFITLTLETQKEGVRYQHLREKKLAAIGPQICGPFDCK